MDLRRLPIATGALVLAAVLCCSGQISASASDSVQPPGWDEPVRLADVVDYDPDPHVVEVHLEAIPAVVELASGVRVEAWTYNGSMPGPLIRIRVGDRLVVRFTNRLPQPTTIHWHGLRIPAQMDGVPGHSQPEVPPGGTFTYDFVVPDAGLFWYHPHVLSAAQVGFGLYGALLVDDPDDGVAVEDEIVLVLSDISVLPDGRMEPPDSGGATAMVFGREGNHVLVNGRERPRLVVRAGAPQRWRVVNAAKSRYFQLFLDGQPLVQIGGDGGLQESPAVRDRILLAPGERADLLVAPQATRESELTLASPLHDRGYGSVEYREQPDLLTFRFADLPPVPGPLPLPAGRVISPPAVAGATKVGIDLTLGQGSDGTFEFGINGVPFAKDRPIVAALGETQIWTVTNRTKWSHPFHLHGYSFLVLDGSGQPIRPLAWKDTVDVPRETSVSFVVRFDDRPGMWMYHCHILDHADGGMMGMVEVRHTRKQ
ncbi:MAG: multicopper oxidase family protein [Vicinamibacterales bacterium]